MPGRTALAAAIFLAATAIIGRAAETVAPPQTAPAATTEQQARTAPPANLLPTADPAALRPADPATAPPPTPAPSGGSLQHEFHGGFTTIFGVTNGVPQSD